MAVDSQSHPASPGDMAFWGSRGRLYVTSLSILLGLALLAEWHSVQSSSTKGRVSLRGSKQSTGLNESRQLQMKPAAAAGSFLTKHSRAAADSGKDSSSGQDSSSSSTAAEVKFTQVHPELGTNPNVQAFEQTVYGRMEKKGHLRWEHWSIHKAEARFDNYLTWRLARTVNGIPVHTEDSYTCAAADHPKLPFPGCHVFINHK